MAKHKTGTVWGLRWPPNKIPNGVVRTADNKSLFISIWGNKEEWGEQSRNPGFEISRKDARLLAKRIIQCLDGTK